jgi:hypothetical protein
MEMVKDLVAASKRVPDTYHGLARFRADAKSSFSSTAYTLRSGERNPARHPLEIQKRPLVVGVALAAIRSSFNAESRS